jgi:CheY-like chemotaxis protein
MTDFNMSNYNKFPPLLKHDFKNLLNPVISLSSLLLKTADKKLSGDELDYLRIILKNGQEMLNIINESPSFPVEEKIDSDSSVSGHDERITGSEKAAIRREEEPVMLVIDDDPDNLIAVKAILEHDFNNAFKVIHAESGKEGIDVLEHVKPRLILLDITLPDISGFILVKSIKNFFAGDKVPVIAFTALDINEYRSKLISTGFDDIIPKPFEIEGFVEKIKKWSGKICL